MLNETVNIFSKLANQQLKGEIHEDVITDPEIQRFVHGLQKKNSTTKLKILNELRSCLATKEPWFFEQFTNTFINIYRRYVDGENERRILEQSNVILGLICKYAKKTLQPRFVELLPQWFMMMNDMDPEISQSALNAFEIGFPLDKQPQAFQLASNQYLKDLKHYLNLSFQTVKTEVGEDNADFLYERLKVAAIKGITTALKLNPTEAFAQQIMEILDFSKKAPVIIQLMNTKKTRIVAAVLETLDALLLNTFTSPLLLPKTNLLLQQTIPLFEEKDRVVQQSLWKGYLLHLLQKSKPEEILKIPLEEKLLDLVSKAGYGLGQLLYNNILRIVALCPFYATVNKEELYKQRIASCRKLMEAIAQGLNHEEARFFSNYLINAYFETLYFLICRRLLPALDNLPLYNNLRGFAIKAIIILTQAAFRVQDKTTYQHNPYQQLPYSLAQFFQAFDSDQTKIIDDILGDLKTLEVDDYSVFVATIQAFLNVNGKAQGSIREYIKWAITQIYTTNNTSQGSQLFKIVPTEFIIFEDAQERIHQNLIQFFDRVPLLSLSDAVKGCIEIKTYLAELERFCNLKVLDNLLSGLLTQYHKKQLTKDEQLAFKSRWICLMVFTSSIDSNYYLEYIKQQDPISEYSIVQKYLKEKIPQNALSAKFVSLTLQVENLSLKIFLPILIYENKQVLLNIYGNTADKLKKNVQYLPLFEELSLIVPPNKLIFTVISSLWIKKERCAFLLKQINNAYCDELVQWLSEGPDNSNDKFISLLEELVHRTSIEQLRLVKVLKFSLTQIFPWKALQILNVEKSYFTELFNNEQFQEIAIFVASNYSSISLHDHSLKRFIQNLCLNQVQPVILDSHDTAKVLKFIKFLFDQSDIVYGVAVRSLVRQMLEDGIHNEQLNGLLMEELNLGIKNKDIGRMITLRQMKFNIDIKDAVDQFLSSQNIQFIDVLLLQDKLSEISDAQLQTVIDGLFYLELENNYASMVCFDLINKVSETRTITPFAAYVKRIFILFRELFKRNSTKPEKYYSFALISALSFLRKVLSFIEAFPVEFADSLNFQLPDTLISLIDFCKDISPEFMDEQNHQLFVEYAETFIRVIQHDLWLNHDPVIYYQLLASPYVAIQKAAFLALKLNPKTDPEIEGLLSSIDLAKNERDDEEFEITFPLDSKILTHLLAWLTIQDSTQFRQHYPKYLSNLVYLLNFLNISGVQPRFSHKEIYSQDIDLIVIQDDQSELLKIIVISFYKFIVAQQSYFKQWFNQECNASQRKQLEDLLIYISKAIYLREVEMIESKQVEWRCEGFDIFVSKQQQEITAVYQKEEQKIEIVIQLPVGYPLKQLKIEAKKGVKLGEDKLQRWSLMIRQLLQQNTDTILSALKAWKLNIDKQFEGLEECAICYYVINNTTGELPKMACRTCKHLFHSYCIQKWFQSSNKSDCPLCKSQFL